MTAPDHLRITGPEDILGFIPHSLGYWPENSLVAMTLQGKRLGATLRVDLPVPGSAGDRGGGSGRGGGGSRASGRGSALPKRGSGQRDLLADFARNVVAYLQADDLADGSLLAFFTDTDTDSPGGGHAWAGLLKELELALEAAGLPLRDAWMIGAEFWRNAYCDDPECCGTRGRPVEQIRNSRLNAEMVYRGSSVGAVPGAQGTKPAPLPVDPAVRAAECGWAEQFSPRRRDRAQFDQVLDVWTMAMQAATGWEYPPGPPPSALAPGTTAPDAGMPDAVNQPAVNQPAVNQPAGNLDPSTFDPSTLEPSSLDPSSLDPLSSDPRAAGQPLQFSPELAGYLRASLCVPSWRDAVLVMAAAGRSAAERGAEDFGMFDAEAGSADLPGTMSVSRLGPTPSPLSGTVSDRMPDRMSDPASRPRSVLGNPPPEAPAVGGPAAGAIPGAEAVAGYGEVLLGLAPSVPDWTLMVGLQRVLERLGALGDGESTAAAVTARGWIEWCRGRGSYADALYQQALQEHPGYRLAELLAELGRRGTLCGWAARREAAWQKFAPDAA
ncbi:DUF4192 family protein [Arthrobacter sp. ok362]|uniref:DUF4192 family protein n=1 Tax=Arthrobacter sp. ok362 TaxID=1761745 RepID=UPI00088B00C4|nr:DUF4192 family protein [Arthrobacter sp. ok362]SDM06923.1 protein of unknown function [Arthrobacter sp. ok362]